MVNMKVALSSLNQLAEDCGEVPRGMSSWIEIDWKASWDNLTMIM